MIVTVADDPSEARERGISSGTSCDAAISAAISVAEGYFGDPA